MSSFRQLMMRSKGGGSPIPAQYEVVDYIQSSGTQYINTGLVATSGFHIKTRISFTTTAETSWRCICGCHNLVYPYQRNFIMLTEALNSRFNNGISCGAGNGDKYTSDYQLVANTFYDIEASNVFSNMFVKVNNIEKTISIVDANPSNSYSSRVLYMLGNNNSSSGATQFFYGTIGATQITISNELVADYVPVLDTQTNKYGMYDKISKQFKGNLGSGDFSGGNE